MERTKNIENLLKKYVSDPMWKEMFLSDLSQGEEEIPFSNLCAIIRQENVLLSPEDKKLIDEIGESIWSDGPYWERRMQTKYWKDIVSQNYKVSMEIWDLLT